MKKELIKKMRKLMTFLCLAILITGCISEAQFSSSDPLILDLIAGIETYEEEQGQPPESLDELVPDYLPALEHPQWVNSVSYEYDAVADSWQLQYFLENGGNAIYYSSGNWLMDTFPRITQIPNE